MFVYLFQIFQHFAKQVKQLKFNDNCLSLKHDKQMHLQMSFTFKRLSRDLYQLEIDAFGLLIAECTRDFARTGVSFGLLPPTSYCVGLGLSVALLLPKARGG